MRPLPVVPPLDLPSRRDVLRWIGIGTAAALMPACHGKAGVSVPPAPTLRFFTEAEANALGALADAIFPPDKEPGASALGAVTYIDRLLSAFDPATPEVFAGGPFSGRAPLPASNGTASTSFPPNDFATFLPLDRWSERAWRLYLYGSDGVTGGGPNDAVLGKTVGLRDQVRNGLQKAMQSSTTPLEKLDAATLNATLNALDANFRDTLVSLVSQGVFGAPEYGGNKDGGGWKIIHFEGDSQPLGYSIYDETAGQYRERPEAPTSSANPGADPAPLDDDTRMLISTAIAFLGGQQFS